MENKVNSFTDWIKLSQLYLKNYLQERIYIQPVIFGFENMWFYSWSQGKMLLLFCLIFMTESRKTMRKFSKRAKVSTSLFATIASLKTGFLICIYLLLIKSLFSLAIHRSCSKNCSDRFWIHVTGWTFPLKWYLQFSRAKLFNDRCFKCRQNFFKNNRVRTVKVYVCLQSIALNLYYIEIFFILYYQRK